MRDLKRIPNAPAGDEWFNPAGGTRFKRGSYARVNKFGSVYHRRYVQVLAAKAVTGDPLVYAVATIDVVDDEAEIIRLYLTSLELEAVSLNAMQIIALQARPRPPQRGREGHE